MNKKELVSAVAENCMISKAEAENVISIFMESVQTALARGEQVSILGFGSFNVKDRPERTGRNPATGEPTTIPARKAVLFKAGATLKADVQ